jgi:hypothetical protein
MPHSATYQVSATWAGGNSSRQVSPGPGETKDIELRLYEEDRIYLITVDYVLQPNGSRDFSASDCERGTKKATAREKGTLGNVLRFCLPSSKPDSAIYDVVCHQRPDEITFDSRAEGGGLVDMGPVDCDSVTEAPEGGYTRNTIVCRVGHVYVVNTYEGCFAKFIIKSIEPRGSR